MRHRKTAGKGLAHWCRSPCSGGGPKGSLSGTTFALAGAPTEGNTSSVKRHMMLIGRAAGRGAFKGAALVGAFGIIVAAWWWDASVLTAAADANLQLIKIVTSKLPFDWGSKCRKRAADFRRRSRPLAHRGCRHRQSRHAQHRLPLSPPAVKAKRLHDFERVISVLVALPRTSLFAGFVKFTFSVPVKRPLRPSRRGC